MYTRESIENEWSQYLISRKSGVKKQWKPIFEENLRKLDSLSGEELDSYLYALCEAYFDFELNIPIENPKIWSKILKQWQSKVNEPDVKLLMWVNRAFSFNGVYKLFQMEPIEVLEKIIEIDPNNNEAERLIFLDRLDLLDFAMHHLPSSLVIDESVCYKAIERCDNMLKKAPNLSSCKTRFGGDFYYYKKMFLGWLKYKSQDINQDFYEWLNEQ